MSKVLVVDGYDMVGKYTFIESLDDCSIYAPDDDLNIYCDSNTMDYLYGYVVAKTLLTCKTSGMLLPEKAVIYTSPITGFAVDSVYNEGTKSISYDLVNSFIIKLIRAFDKVELIYIEHSSTESTKAIYDEVLRRYPGEFISFDEYTSQCASASLYFAIIYGVIKERYEEYLDNGKLVIRTIESYVDENNEMKFREVSD